MRIRMYFLRVVVFSLFQTNYGQGDVVCPQGSRKAGQTCFMYHTSHSMSWSSARKECQRTPGSDLLITRNQVLFNVIKEAVIQHEYSFWVGATDSASEMNFKWVDGSSCCSPYWIPGEPNNYNNKNEDCVNFWDDAGGGLNDENCSQEINFICEFKASVCPTGSKQVGGICLRYHEGSYGWNTARSYCQTQYGTDLLIVRNDAVFRDIQHAVQNRGDHGFWVGATRQGHSFRWVDNSACCGHYWNPGEPNGASGSGDNCVHVWDSGSDKGLNDVACDDPIGFICQECPEISHCVQRHCTNIHDYVCDMCEDNYVFYKTTHSGKKCERMCSFDAHACWPGTCSDSLTSSCTCATEFQAVKSSSQTMCQLKTSKTPTINSCQTIIGGANGEAKRTTAGKCPELKDFYGNFQPTSLAFDMHSDFSVNITAFSKNRPHYIAEENFGITDTTLHVKRIPVVGTEQTLDTFKQKTDVSQSTNATSTEVNNGNYTLSQPKYTLRNGERLCVLYKAQGGGYVKRKDFRTNKVLSPLPYDKTSSEETICYRYDDERPQHCLETYSCSHSETEPIQIANRVSRTPIISLAFSGWSDPTPAGGIKSHASGIESYEITVNEVVNGIVNTKKVFSIKMGPLNTSLTLNMTSNSPRLYAINLEVKDVADNVQQARRFVLYDGTTNITSRKDRPFLITSASKSSNYLWQTHHNDICLDWRDHFYNKFYMENSLLGKINSDAHGLISGIYEQQTGLLPVSGTPNVYGITQFIFTWSLNEVGSPSMVTVPDFLNQTYCHSFSLKDGQTYTLNIEAIDIVNNTFSENRTVHIDRTVPHINNIWLSKNGVKRLYVHDDTDLSQMNLTFEALDPHSGLLNIEWTFGTMDPEQQLGAGIIGIAVLGKENCPKNLSDSCYCPDVGKCEYFKYSIPLNKLIQNNTHIGSHNRNYLFSIKVTNNARLSNVEHVDVLVDDSPPERGVVYEGAIGSRDFDYTSDNSYIVRWHGFIDHESGIKEYRLGLADMCLTKAELLVDRLNSNITEYTAVLFTESSVRLIANFTGRKFVSIIAINNAMEASDVACSDGITRDVNPPSIQNLRVENGKWAESLFCLNGEAWFFRSDLKKVRLLNTDTCNKRCINETTDLNLSHFLPTERLDNNDTSISDFLCNNFPIYDKKTVIYLPNDKIVLSWDRNEGESQIEDYYVGFGQTPTITSALSIIDYTSTDRKPYFHTRHLGVGSGALFYAHIKALSKAKLETVSIIGPMMIDETPPYFREKPTVRIDGDSILVGWSNETIYDLEQTERINKVLFQIVHDGVLSSHLLEWRLDDSKPCPRFAGGCFRYPLKRLQRIDTDLGLNFTVRVYAYNNAGHFTLNETDSFSIPSRYPPGQAVVIDTDPEKYSTQSNQDVDVHFTANKLCSYWNGFKHHENVSVEIGVGTTKTDANVVPFQRTNDSSITCMQSTDIHFDTWYYVLLRASCSGGKSISTSNGILVMNKTDLNRNLKISIGEYFERKELVNSASSNTSEIKLCSPDYVEIGTKYKLTVLNVTEYSSFVSKDFIVNDRNYNKHTFVLELTITPLVKRLCLMYDLNSGQNISVLLHKSTAGGFISSSKRLPVSWSYGRNDLLSKLNFKITLVAVSSNTSFGNITRWRRSSQRTSHIFDLDNYPTDSLYTIALMPCSRIHCLEYTLSSTFQIERTIDSGEIEQSSITTKGSKRCIGVSFSWQQFTAISTITIYKWSISRDNEANSILTSWKAIPNKGENVYKVNECINIPVHGQSTLYLCVRAYSTVGNVKTKCQKASTQMESAYNQDTVYDMDMAANTWEAIKEMIHSSNIGARFSVLHDAEVDFGTTDSAVAGVLLHATERNVTWYLMKRRDIPSFDDCNKDTDCVHSQTTDLGFSPFDSDMIERNRFYFICAYSDSTSVSRETYTEKLQEIRSCSNGFVLDDTPPTPGKVTVRNTNGFLTYPSEIEITWNGFDDNIDVQNLGYIDRINYYSYAIGTRSGGTDVRNYTIVGDTHRVVEKDIDVAVGTYLYVTVKATDQAGLTVTRTSKQLIVDTSPPVTGIVTINDARDKIAYVSSLECAVSLDGFMDYESGIEHFEVELGTGEDSERIFSVIVYKEDHFHLKLPDSLHDGYKYYVSVKAVNRAGLSTVRVSEPFVRDRSPPTGGHVLDGDWNLKKDVDYQNTLGYIQGHWNGFMDPHSGIKYYRVGLGTKPRRDDIEHMVNVGLLTDILWNGTYHIGQKYYITVEACNAAELCRIASSDGLLFDNSQPIHGIVRVGTSEQHQKYFPQSTSVHVHWAGFEDPQSGIDHYDTCLGTRPGMCDILPLSTSLLESNIIKTGLSLKSGTNIYASVTVFNKAGMNVTSSSDAFQIDNTPPELMEKPSFLRDFNAVSGKKAQWEKSVLHMSWKFRDEESKIAFHIISLKTHHEGHTPVENIHVGNVDRLTLTLDEMNWLHIGDVYFVVVTSCNVAGLCSSARSDNLLIDSTPPHQGGFKPPLTWQNHVDSKNKKISKITLTWYGFVDVESSIDEYYLKVSRNYSGHELSGGVVVRNANNRTEETSTLTLTEQINRDDLLVLTIWAKNTAGMNSTVSKISVSALRTEIGSSGNSTGILEIQKHSCDIHFCNKDCTCAIVGKQCVEVETNDTCDALNKTDAVNINLPVIDVFGGLPENPQNMTVSSACLAGHWKSRDNDENVLRYEWSMGIKDQPVGEGIFDLKTEQPWRDVGKDKQTVYCLPKNSGLKHNTNYIIYVRAWYSKIVYGIFTSLPILVDQTPPQQSRGRFIKDSDSTCNFDFDVIDWMENISACWNGLFLELQGQIIHYTVSLGTSINGSDIFPRTNLGLLTNITLMNLTLSHGTKYFFTVTAYNNVGLETTVTSDGFLIDMDTPVEGVIFNTEKHTDMGYQSSTDTFNISWHGFLDNYSGIRSYFVAVVEDSTTDYENVSFTKAVLQTTYRFRHLNLEHSKYYKGLVKAFDNAGHISNIAISKAKMIDKTPPSALSCTKFVKQQVNLTLENDGTAAFTTNLAINNYYVIVGRLSDVTLEQLPTISIGRRVMYLPIAINNNGSVDFEYNFLSPLSGFITISISAQQVYSTNPHADIDLQLLRCSSLLQANDDRSAVNVQQVGPSRIAVNCLIMDEESSLYKVSLGAGTTLGGFQIRPLSRLHGGTSGVIDVDVEHDTRIYVTVLAENHAGLRSVFKAYPQRMDKTPPFVSDIENTVFVNPANPDKNVTYTTVTIIAKWKADDKESGIKYCLCGLGKTFQGTEITDLRLPDTNETCLFDNIKLDHGSNAFVSVKCINNVEIAATVVSEEIIISTTSPDITLARVNIITVGELWNIKPFSTSNGHLTTYAQTDKSRIQMEWEGFQDLSGLQNYEYRITFDNNTIADWKTTGGKTMADANELDLDFGKLYLVEVRAVNSGKYISDPVAAGVIVHKEPKLAGESVYFARNNQHLMIDWSKVFMLDEDLQVTYDVTIGTRLGFSDITELRKIDTSHYEVILPRSTLVTPNISELFISITCTSSTGLFNVYIANYKL